MTRLIILAEGPTEVSFVDRVLGPHLYGAGHIEVRPVLMGERGGVSKWAPVRREILNYLKQSPDIYVTTMVDYSGMPQSWPGRREVAGTRTVAEKANQVKQAMLTCIVRALENFHPVRFIPNVIMHEFEGLLFSNPDALAGAIGRPDLAQRLQSIVDECGSPEEINSSYDTFPSRRLKGVDPRYQKVLHGTEAARQIGLATMRSQCPLFDQWVSKLERAA